MDQIESRKILNLSVGMLIIAIIIVGIVYLAGRALSSKEDLAIKNMNTINYTITGAIIKTNFGNIEIDFLKDKAPVAVNNFIKLSEDGFYDGIRFHRVIKDFMIQAGDPLSKDMAMKNRWGTGGPGYKFNDELTGQEKYTLGTVAMANAGPNTNGSQFFIVTANPEVNLPPNYTVFGRVVNGIGVANKINNMKTIIPGDVPVDDVIIESIVLK